MFSEKHVKTLKPGDCFRDWLIHVFRERISNKKCKVNIQDRSRHLILSVGMSSLARGTAPRVAKFMPNLPAGRRFMIHPKRWIRSFGISKKWSEL
jgi:hypothetical protein